MFFAGMPTSFSAHFPNKTWHIEMLVLQTTAHNTKRQTCRDFHNPLNGNTLPQTFNFTYFIGVQTFTKPEIMSYVEKITSDIIFSMSDVVFAFSAYKTPSLTGKSEIKENAAEIQGLPPLCLIYASSAPQPIWRLFPQQTHRCASCGAAV